MNSRGRPGHKYFDRKSVMSFFSTILLSALFLAITPTSVKSKGLFLAPSKGYFKASIQTASRAEEKRQIGVTNVNQTSANNNNTATRGFQTRSCVLLYVWSGLTTKRVQQFEKDASAYAAIVLQELAENIRPQAFFVSRLKTARRENRRRLLVQRKRINPKNKIRKSKKVRRNRPPNSCPDSCKGPRRHQTCGVMGCIGGASTARRLNLSAAAGTPCVTDATTVALSSLVRKNRYCEGLSPECYLHVMAVWS